MNIQSLISAASSRVSRNFFYAFAALLFLACDLLAAPPRAASVPYAVSRTGAGNSHLPVFSADGHHVAFVSQANNLVTNDDLGPWLDLFVRDLNASNTVLVSVSTNGFGGANSDVAVFNLSSNAQVVAFETAASNLVPGDTNFATDIFVRNLAGGSTALVSVNTSNAGSGNGASFNPLLSADGRYVIFESLASNLVTNDFNGTNDVFLRDLLAGTTMLLSVDAAGTASAAGPSEAPAISDNGRYVAFISRATNLVAGVTNTLGEVYRRDVPAGVTEWASAGFSTNLCLRGGCSPIPHTYAPAGPLLTRDGRYVAFKASDRAVVRWDFQSTVAQTNERVHQVFTNASLGGEALAASSLRISDDGRYVAFVANSFAAPGTPATNAFVRRIDFDTLVELVGEGGGAPGPTNYLFAAALVSTALDSTNTLNRFASLPAMSRDGSRFVFLCENEGGATNPAPGAIYLRDMASPFSAVLGTNRAGGAGRAMNGVAPALTSDGSLAAWESPDDEIIESDVNRAWDVFARDVASGDTHLVSARHAALPAATGVALSAAAGPDPLSANGSHLALITSDNNFLPGDTNLFRDVFLRDLRNSTNIWLNATFPTNLPFQPWVNPAFASGLVVSLSADGRFALFTYIGVTYIGIGYQPQAQAIFWRDVLLGTNDLVATFTEAGPPALSSDGRLVAFQTRANASGLASGLLGDNNGVVDILLRDFRTLPATNRVVSVTSTGEFTGNGASINPVFSPDCRWIAFQSSAMDLTADSANSTTTYQLFARDLLRDRTKLVSFLPAGTTNGAPLPGGATNPVFSLDGRFIFFMAGATNTIYRHAILDDVAALEAGLPRVTNLVVCTDCANPSSSADGRFVAFETRRPTNQINDVFVKDLLTGQTERMSVNLAGTGDGNGPSFTPLLSHDAHYVVFASKASDLTVNDTNRVTDIFVRDRLNHVTHCLSRNLAGTATGNRVSDNPLLSADGRVVVFQSFASDLVPGDYNDTRDVFVVTLGGPDTDGDGLDDDWEMAYFNSLARDGSGDFDSDGARDLDEFRAGTDPTNLGSILRVLTLATSVNAPGNGTRSTVLLWSASPGRTYRVQFKDMVDAGWTDLPGDIVASGTTASSTDTSVGQGEARFYRVAVVQ